MIDEGKYCIDVLNQIKAAKAALVRIDAKKVDFGEIKNIFLSNGQSATGMTLEENYMTNKQESLKAKVC